MGALSPFRQSSSHPASLPSVNPDPAKFKIVQIKRYGRYVMVVADYQGCTNFEGRKVLIYRDFPPVDSITTLDPHFSKDSVLSPLARFEPSCSGMRLAEKFCDMCDSLEE